VKNLIFLLVEWIAAHFRAGVWPNFREFYAITSMYRADGRHYHTLIHIRDCLRFVNRFFPRTKNVHLVKLALFYHDCYYDVTRKDNELRSADRWKLRDILTRGKRQRVYDLIMLTAGHQSDRDMDELSKVMNDADLHVLGQARGLYLDYAKGVWKEYSQFGADAYTLGRIDFLKTFSKGRVFRTKKMYYLFEHAAISNMKAEIAILRARPYKITG
jgi:predicted metal-dependent HD superfamily phosphohydrolase